ncbi:response regulator transcription factor (plasmid) [Chloroflexota bacterium]|nr:response regulator transcription factor [Chloroflexota bacterium]
MAEKYPLIIFSNLKDTVDVTSKALAGTPFGLAGITDSFINARTLLSQYAPEFLLIHLNENCQETNVLVQRLKTVSPRTRILVIPNSWDCNTVFDTIRAGADVIIPDRGELTKLPRILQTLLDDEIYLPSFVASSLLERSRQEVQSPSEFPFLLTDKEKEILEQFSQGTCPTTVADNLGLSHELVRAYADNVIKKIHFVDIARKQYEEIMSGLLGYHTHFKY